jgi:PAS domain S-box-containing protein
LTITPANEPTVALRLAIDRAILSILADAEGLEVAAPRIVAAVGVEIGWHASSLLLVGEGAQMLYAAAIWQSPGVRGEEFQRQTAQIRFGQGVGLPGRAWDSGQPQWIPDITEDPNFPRSAAASKAGLHTGCAVPLRGGGRVVGVLEAFHQKTLDPQPGVIEALAGVAPEIGAYIERQQSEQALRRSEELKAAILESAFDAVIGMDHEGRVIEFNRTAERMFRYDRADALGAPLAELIVPPRLRERHRRGVARYIATGEGLLVGRGPVELTAMRADGSEFPVELVLTRIGESEPPAFSAAVRDISERKRADQRATRLAAIVGTTHDAVVAADPAGTIVIWNRGAEKMYGHTAEEAIGRPMSLIVPPERVEEIAELEKAVRQGKLVESHETQRLHKDGSRVDVALTLSPISDAGGNFDGIAGIARDIRDQKRTESILRFLVDAGVALEASNDLEMTLQQLAELTVPYLGDGCMVDLRDETGDLRRVGAASVDPSIEPVLKRLQRHSFDPEGPHPIARAARSGTLQVVDEFTDDLRRDIAEGDDEYLAALRDWPATAAVVAPLVAHGRILGTIAVASFSRERTFDRQQIWLIEELARRVSTAVDNARLYSKRSPAAPDR